MSLWIISGVLSEKFFYFFYFFFLVCSLIGPIESVSRLRRFAARSVASHVDSSAVRRRLYPSAAEALYVFSVHVHVPIELSHIFSPFLSGRLFSRSVLFPRVLRRSALLFTSICVAIVDGSVSLKCREHCRACACDAYRPNAFAVAPSLSRARHRAIVGARVRLYGYVKHNDSLLSYVLAAVHDHKTDT